MLNMYNHKILLIAFAFLLIAGAGSVRADFAVGSSAKIYVPIDAQTYEFAFSLQNVVNAEGDLSVSAEIVEGTGYVSFRDGSTFEVPQGEVLPAWLVFTVPDNVQEGDTFPVSVSFTPDAAGGDGTVQFTQSSTKNLELVIEVPQAEEEVNTRGLSSFWWFLLVLVIIIIVIIIIVSRRRRSSGVVASNNV